METSEEYLTSTLYYCKSLNYYRKLLLFKKENGLYIFYGMSNDDGKMGQLAQQYFYQQIQKKIENDAVKGVSFEDKLSITETAAIHLKYNFLIYPQFKRIDNSFNRRPKKVSGDTSLNGTTRKNNFSLVNYAFFLLFKEALALAGTNEKFSKKISEKLIHTMKQDQLGENELIELVPILLPTQTDKEIFSDNLTNSIVPSKETVNKMLKNLGFNPQDNNKFYYEFTNCYSFLHSNNSNDKTYAKSTLNAILDGNILFFTNKQTEELVSSADPKKQI